VTLPADYFARMYAESADPWGFRTRWYEQRKRELTVAALDRPRYRRAFEPGCSNGILTAALAARCDGLLAADVDETALAAAREALAGLPHVQLRRLAVPDEWPDGRFDLVVVSELGYYLDDGDLTRLLDRAVASLDDGGVLLAVHWRHPVPDYPATGDRVHEALRARPELTPVVRHEEEDFLLDLLTRGTVPSPARREGLVG
jgi:trans-aconitate methyltransferase